MSRPPVEPEEPPGDDFGEEPGSQGPQPPSMPPVAPHGGFPEGEFARPMSMDKINEAIAQGRDFDRIGCTDRLMRFLKMTLPPAVWYALITDAVENEGHVLLVIARALTFYISQTYLGVRAAAPASAPASRGGGEDVGQAPSPQSVMQTLLAKALEKLVSDEDEEEEKKRRSSGGDAMGGLFELIKPFMAQILQAQLQAQLSRLGAQVPMAQMVPQNQQGQMPPNPLAMLMGMAQQNQKKESSGNNDNIDVK